MSRKLLIRVAKLIPLPQKHKTLPSLAFVYHFEPPADDNQELGSFFVAIEVMGKQSVASHIIDQIIKTVGEKYYNEEYKGEPADRFENALAEVNKNIAGLLKSKYSEVARKISAVVAIACGNELHVTRCGKAAAYLYRDEVMTNVTADIDNTADKLFTDIATGSLAARDKLLLATPAVFFQFPKDQLKNLIADNAPNTAVAKMSSTLSGHDNANRCGAIVAELLTSEMAAEETLPDEPEEATVGNPTTPLDTAKEIALPAGKKLVDKGKTAAKKSTDWTKNKAVPKIKQHAKHGWNHVWTNYINPNPKLALVVAGAVAIALIGLFILIGQSHSASKESMASFKEAIALTDSAEAKLSLGEKETAAAMIDKAVVKLQELDKKEGAKSIDKAAAADSDIKSRSITFASLQERISQLDDKIAGITRIKYETLADFSANKNTTLGPIALLNDTLYAINTADGHLYEVNTQSKSSNRVGSADGLKTAIAATPSYSKDGVFFLTSQPSVLQYKAGKLSDAKLSAGTWEQGIDIASYSSNLYVLTPSTKQVYRHTKTGAGFGAKTSYVKTVDDSELEQATSLLVNGSVLVADKAGKISLFFNGTQKPFDIKDLPKDVNLGEIKKIIWSAKTQQIYVLSKDGQKITALRLDNDSGASYVKQYATTSGEQSITSVAVDDDKGLVYAAAGQKIIVFKQ